MNLKVLILVAEGAWALHVMSVMDFVTLCSLAAQSLGLPAPATVNLASVNGGEVVSASGAPLVTDPLSNFDLPKCHLVVPGIEVSNLERYLNSRCQENGALLDALNTTKSVHSVSTGSFLLAGAIKVSRYQW